MTLAAIFAAGLLGMQIPGEAEGAVCLDGQCAAPSDTAPQLSVLSPVAEMSVTPMKQGARLDTLAGRTFALVGGSFMASVTHPELKRLLLAEFPDAKVYLLGEIGAAGPFPRPGVVRREKDEFQAKLKSCKVDAVISGNGGCGLCTPKETGSCLAAEALGIPSVLIAAPGFVDQARMTARTAGLAELRVAEYPGAFASHTREELLKNTREILWPQIKRALTAPLTPAGESVAPPAETNSVVCAGTWAEIQRVFLDSGWTDGLPVNPPTAEAVAEFLAFTDLPPDHLVGVIPPAQRAVTVRHVAVNGVMSGCPPEFMPILLAVTEALKDGDFRRPLISTHSWTPYCWLNGPLARQLGFDAAQGETCEPKNAVLGRFLNLALVNLGGYRVKENRMGTFGYLMPWCFAEDDAAAIAAGWKPHHMQRGHRLNDSAITLSSAINWGNNLVPATTDPVHIKDMMAWDAVEKQQMAVGSGMPLTARTFLVTPPVAKALSAGYASKQELELALVETARNPLGSRAYANYWGNPGSSFDPARFPLSRQERRIAEAEGAEETPTPPWLAWTKQERVSTVPVMAEGRNCILVTGDPARNKEMCLPGGAAVTVKISLPAKWDELVAARGYQPLANFELKSDLTPDNPPPRRQARPGTSGGRTPGARADRPRGFRGEGGGMRPRRPFSRENREF